MRRDAGLPPGTLDMLILRVLTKRAASRLCDRPQKIRLLSKDELSVEEGSLYPALQKLLLKGWSKQRAHCRGTLSDANRRVILSNLPTTGFGSAAVSGRATHVR
jgi:PadR family transcriptional regulator PadR